MTTDQKDKMSGILRRLLERTRADEVNWQQVRHPEWGSVFLVRFPRSNLYLNYFSPPAEPDEINAIVTRTDGTVVRSWKASEGDDDWNLASSLYSEAERVVTGWDQVLTEIETAVSGTGKVGLPPAETTSTRGGGPP